VRSRVRWCAPEQRERMGGADRRRQRCLPLESFSYVIWRSAERVRTFSQQSISHRLVMVRRTLGEGRRRIRDRQPNSQGDEAWPRNLMVVSDPGERAGCGSATVGRGAEALAADWLEGADERIASSVEARRERRPDRSAISRSRCTPCASSASIPLPASRLIIQRS
jgi:hypothetical protein